MIKTFLAKYFPILFGFIFFRLMTQTDLFMISEFGENAIAVLGIPGKLMILDMIVAFSLGPVISVMVAKNKDNLNDIPSSLTFSLIIGLILMILGLPVYLYLLKEISNVAEILSLGKQAVLIMTFSIPIRMVSYISSMILHSCGKGKFVTPIDILLLLTNGILNYFLMYYLKFGAIGCFISTYICSFIEMSFLLFLIKKLGLTNKLIKIPKWIWIKNLFSNVKFEFFRNCLEHLSSIVILLIIGHLATSKVILVSYSAASEIQLFLLMPLIALMRTVSIQTSTDLKLFNKEYIHSFIKPFYYLLLISLFFLISSYFLLPFIGKSLLHLSDDSFHWWEISMICFLIASIINVFNFTLKGILQGHDKFPLLFKIELLTLWPIYIPTMGLGIYFGNPWLMWSGLIIVAVIELLVLGKTGLNLVKISTRSNKNSLEDA